MKTVDKFDPAGEKKEIRIVYIFSVENQFCDYLDF